jgi:predicted Zn-dependent protease
MPVLGGRILPAVFVATLAASAGAQQKACDIDEGSPGQIARASLDLQLAQSAATPDAAAPKLKDAIKLLTDGDVSKNPTGRAFVLGKTLVLWSTQPSMAGGMTTRGAVGFTTNPTAPYDLVAGIDSAFTVVETANADCLTTTAQWRQQKGWVDLVNHAIELSNAGKTDSAIAVAKRSLQMSRNAPYGYMVLAQAAAKNNQPKDAITYYQQAIGAAKDTTYADTRRQLELSLGQLAAMEAQQATGADKAAYIQEARTAFDALAKDPGTKYADAARTGQATLASLSGDTTAIRATYQDQLANPSAFSYSSLMQGAVTAAKANQNEDAIKLFEAARTMNPYHRDVLYNLARLYVLDSAYSKGIPLAQQLIQVDPDNSDNYELLSIAYAAMQKRYDRQEKAYEAMAKKYGERANTSKSTRVVKAAVDSAARMSPLIKAYADSSRVAVDSALKYNGAGSALPVKVSFTEFTPDAAKATLGGSVQNETDAAKSVTLKIEFLDKSGNVVATQDVPVGPIAAHASADFTASGTGAGIVAFRYAPVS